VLETFSKKHQTTLTSVASRRSVNGAKQGLAGTAPGRLGPPPLCARRAAAAPCTARPALVHGS
jgi:hypothetical protein